MSTDYTIEFVQYPIVGGLAGHNFVVQKNSAGQVVSEIHGFAYDEHGTQLFIGTKASDRLKGKEFNHKSYYEDEYNRQLVFSGTKEQVEAMWSRAKDAKDLLNLQDLPYPPFGIFSSGPVINSNAVASTMLRVMGMSEPSLGWALVPGAGNVILSPPQISDIQMRRPIPSGGGVSNSGNSSQFTWDWSYDGYTSVLVDGGFVAHSWYGDGDVVDTRLLPSTFDVWSMADFNPAAQHELSFSQILPSTYVSSNGYGIEIDFFLVNQVADDVLDEIGSDLGISGLRGAVSVQIDLVNGDVWKTDFSFTTSNPQSPLAQRLAELNQPKGMEAYQQWFQERAESITRDAVDFMRTPGGSGDESPSSWLAEGGYEGEISQIDGKNHSTAPGLGESAEQMLSESNSYSGSQVVEPFRWQPPSLSAWVQHPSVGTREMEWDSRGGEWRTTAPQPPAMEQAMASFDTARAPALNTLGGIADALVSAMASFDSSAIDVGDMPAMRTQAWSYQTDLAAEVR